MCQYFVPGLSEWKSKRTFIRNGHMFYQSFFSSSLLQKAVFFAQILQRQFTLGYVCCTFENVVVSEFFVVVFLLYTYAAI